MKSTNISSATGRRPEQAAPTAAPMNADSLIGVSRTLSGYLGYSPLVTPRTPPQASISPPAPWPPATSSPKRTTEGSRAISWSSASLIACWNVIVRAMGTPLAVAAAVGGSVRDVDVAEQVGRLRVGGRLGLGHGVVDQGLHLLVDAAKVGLVNQVGAGDPAGELLEAVAGAAQLLDLAGSPVGLLIALEVAVVTVDLALQQGGPAAAPGTGDRLAGRLVHGEEVMAVHDH